MKLRAVLLTIGLLIGLWHSLGSARAFRHAAAGAGLVVMDDVKAAADQFDKALAQNDRPTLYTTVALKAYARAGRPERALEAISVLVKRYPDDAGFYLRRADIYKNLLVSENLTAYLDNREADSEKLKLWSQLQQADLRRAAALGADVPRAKKLGPTQIDNELYGRWQVVAINDRAVQGGNIYEFGPLVFSSGAAHGYAVPMEYEIDNTKDPKRFTVSNTAVKTWTTYSYRVEGDTLLLAWRGTYMDPPSHFGTGMMATVLRLTRVRD